MKKLFIGLDTGKKPPKLTIVNNDKKTIVRKSEVQAKIMWLLMCKRLVTMDDLLDVLWPDPDKMPDESFNNVRVNMHWAKQALRGSGWKIVATWGQGYSLVRDSQ